MKNKVSIPEPFNKYYEVVSVEQALKSLGWDSLKQYQDACDDHDSKYGMYGVEDNEYYNMQHLAWIIARPKYAEIFSGWGYDLLELAKEDNHVILAYQVEDRIYDVSEELADLLVSID